MSWREAARLADAAFGEVALQATYALRQGNPIPPREGRRLVELSRRRVAQSKGLVSGLLAVLALGTGLLLQGLPTFQAQLIPATMPLGLARGGVFAGLLGLELALLWWNGIQAVPVLVGSSAIAVLEPLPIPRTTLRQTSAIVFLRLFDLPAATVLVTTPVAVGLALGPWAGVAAVPGTVCAVVFAVALALVTSRFFVRRVQGARGGGGGTLVRWLYLLLWILPAFGLLGVVVASPPYFRALAHLAAASPSVGALALAATFPLSLAMWPSWFATGGASLGVSSSVGATFLVAGALSLGLAASAILWLYASVARIAELPLTALAAPPLLRVDLHPQRPSSAVLTKDLRLASRTPAYAFLLLLPLLDSVALGLVTFVGPPGSGPARAVALGAVSAAALLATFFGPAFFALEVIAQSYGRTLPLAPRSMAFGKLILVVALYLASGGIVLAITSLRIHEPLVFAAFVFAELPAVVAAGLLELAVLFRWTRAKGLPVTSLYAGTWNVLLVALPGIAVVTVPLAAYVLAGVAVMAVVSSAALLTVGPWAVARGIR